MKRNKIPGSHAQTHQLRVPGASGHLWELPETQVSQNTEVVLITEWDSRWKKGGSRSSERVKALDRKICPAVPDLGSLYSHPSVLLSVSISYKGKISKTLK